MSTALVRTTTGTKRGRLVVRTTGGLVDAARVRQVSAGYRTTTAMLGRNPFFIAHRGGSVSFPEMTRFAYGQAALFGFDALELSLARTVDGVYFGLHDKTLLRTSGVDIDPSTLTWEQVQKYAVNPPSGVTGPPRPYMRFEELAELYGPTHVLFMDNKYVPQTRYTELEALIKSQIPDATTRVVAKFYGVSNEWLTFMKGKGYATWGYFYDTDVSSFASYAPRWDMIGLNYSAPVGVWDQLRAAAPGRPIIGHICPSLVAAQTALDKGAVGVMCSSVVGVSPLILHPDNPNTTTTSTTAGPGTTSTTTSSTSTTSTTRAGTTSTTTTPVPTTTTSTTKPTTTTTTTRAGTTTTTTTAAPAPPTFVDLARSPASTTTIWWEDTRLTKPAGTATPLTAVLDQVNRIGEQLGQRVELSLPEGTFFVDDNFGVIGDGIRLAHRDFRPMVKKLSGSGRKTIITMGKVTDRQRLVVGADGSRPDNSLCLIAADQTSAAPAMQIELCNFTLQAPRLVTAQNKSTFDATYPGGTNMTAADPEGQRIGSADIDFNGIRLRRVAPGSSVHHIRFKGIAASMGVPPGETWAISVTRVDGGLIDETPVRIHDIEVDGRRPDDGAIVGGAAVGGNKSTGVLVERVWAHHTRAGMGLSALWWCPTNGATSLVSWRFVDCHVDQIQALDRPLYGSTENTLINHEQSDGVEYWRCHFGTAGSKVNRRRRILSLNSDGNTARSQADAGVVAPDGKVRLIDCTWGPDGVGGTKLSVQYWGNLFSEGVQNQRSNPVIIRNGADVTAQELFVEGRLA